MTRTPFISATARAPQFENDDNPLGQPVMQTSDFTAVDLASSGGISGGAETGSVDQTMNFSVAPQPEGSTFAWTASGGTGSFVGAQDEVSCTYTFESAATFTMQCVITLAGDADSPKTVTKQVVIS